ncbi:MAG: GWxTD domain-containing protein [Crocinitomicaceae bacterium]
MKLIYLLFFGLLMNSWATCQEQKLRVYLDTKQFYEPSLGNFVEVNFQFVSPTLQYIGENGGLQGELAVLLDFVKEGDTIVSDAYRMKTPFMKDSILEDFYDVRRFSLNPGSYELHLEISDLIRKSASIKGVISVVVESRGKSIQFSDIQNIEVANKGNVSSPFYKSGYEIIPRLSNYYPEELTWLPYYTEVYNSNLLNNKEFGLKESIVDAESKLELEKYTQYIRYKSDTVVPILRKMDIASLKSGNYYLTLSIIDSKMEIVTEKKYFFERTNEKEMDLTETDLILNPDFAKSIPIDSALFYLGSLIPIAGQQTDRTILSVLKEKNSEKASLLIQTFWRTTNPTNAYESWLLYKAQVLYTERLYSNNFLRGYDTDRGRVYLQYGAPTNIIAREVSPTEFPWEIWQYNKIGKFSNKKFLFYNPDLIANNYRLLHSDLIGEPKNLNYSNALKNRSALIDANQQTDATPQMGGQASDYFR